MAAFEVTPYGRFCLTPEVIKTRITPHLLERIQIL